MEPRSLCRLPPRFLKLALGDCGGDGTTGTTGTTGTNGTIGAAASAAAGAGASSMLPEESLRVSLGMGVLDSSRFSLTRATAGAPTAVLWPDGCELASSCDTSTSHAPDRMTKQKSAGSPCRTMSSPGE